MKQQQIEQDILSLDRQILYGHARTIGGVENFFAMEQRQKLFTNFIVIGRFNKDIRTEKQLLVSALRSMVLKYPILACTIEHSARSADYENDYIRVMPRLTLKDVLVNFPSRIKILKDNIDQQLNKLNQLELPFENGKPLWVIGFLDERTLVYISNHCLSDGTSGKAFIEDLQVLLNQPPKEPIGNSDLLLNYEQDFKVMGEIPPSIDSAVDHMPPFFRAVESLYEILKTNLFAYKSPAKCSKEDLHVYRSFNISPDELKSLLHRLKSNPVNKVTLTPYVHNAWLTALNKHLLKNNYFKAVNMLIPCNTRQYISPTDYIIDQFKYGTHTSPLSQTFDTSNQFNWKTISAVNDHYKQAFKEKKFLYSTFGLLKLDWLNLFIDLNDDEHFAKSDIGARRGQTILTNIGMVKPPIKEAEFKLRDVWFCQNSGVTPSCFVINIVSSIDAGLNIVVTMVEGTTSIDEFEMIIDEFKSLLSSYDSIGAT